MTQTGIAMIATYIAIYDVRLVVLSIIVASVASYTALSLAGRVTITQGRAQKLWLAGGAIAMGVGIWSMHFIAMLAYQLPIPMVYDIPTVLGSMVAAVLASGFALFLVSRQKLDWLELVLGSIFMGLGIAAMHYLGMIAMNVEAIVQYDPSLVGLSVVVAICVSGVALWLAFHLRAETKLVGNLRKLGSAIVMGHAIAGMHYTGMAAVSFQPLPRNINFGNLAQPSHTIDNSLLAFEIGIATLIVLGIAVLASLFDQRLSAEIGRTEVLRQSEERFRSLVQNSSDVIAVIAADGTICYTSSSVKQILGYEPEKWFGSKAFDCVHPDDLAQAENLLTAALHCSATNVTTEFRLRHTDNSWREFEVIANNLLAEPSVAGILTTYRDITKRKQAEAALSESKRQLQEQNAVLMELARRKTLSAAGDLHAAVREITEAATNTLKIERASVWLYNRERSKIQCIDLYEWSKSDHSQGMELAAVDYPAYFQALKEERTIPAHDAQTDPRTKEFSQFYLSPLGITSMLDAPIWLAGEMAGVVCHEHIGPAREWTLEEQNFAGSIADLVALAMKGWERKRAEDALRQAEAKYRSIFENTAEGIFQTTVDGHYIVANPALARIYGYASPDELIASLCEIKQQLYVNPNRRDEFIRLLEQDNALSDFESQVYCKDGSIIWISENARTIRDPSGQVIGYEGTVRDITARKQAEIEIQRTQALLNSIIENIPNMIFVKDAEDLKFVRFNKAGEELLGYSRKELIGKNDYDFFSKADAELFIAKDREVLEGENRLEILEEPIQTRYKGLRTLYTKKIPIFNTAGKPRYLLGISEDITDRKQAEEALRESEQKYRSVVNNIKEVIFQMDAAGEWTFLNRAWAEITGFSVEESIGTQFLNYVVPDDLQHTLDLFQTLIERQKEHCQHEFRCLAKDGGCRWIEVYGRVNLDAEGNFIGISGTLNDITERKKVDRMKNEFVSTVSHELRTPLTSILGSLGLVTNGVAGEIPPSAKALLDIAHKNSERLVRLINDILDIEKIESGKMAFNLQPLELMPLLEQAIAANQAYGEQFGVKFVLENSLVGVKVNGDSDRLIQVLTNLLSNAAKFSPANDTVVISVTRHNQAIRVAVTDHGRGIPEEFHNRIFQKFAQADSSDTRQKGGTGLGLSICKAIMEKHGGQIAFATATNVGTTFYFDLPQWDEPAITVAENSKLSPQLPILICEDDPDIAALLKLLLDRAGFKADIAYNAAQAKQLLAQNQYGAMTLDIALPDVDGISLLRELRHQDSTHHLPIVVVSAKAELARQELNGNAITVIDWLNKPIDQTRLVAAVKQATQQIGGKPRILHIEDNSDVRQVVGAIVKNVADIYYAVNLQEAKQKLEQETFELILLDLSLPDGSGLELLPQLSTESQRPTPVVVFSAQEVGRETVQDVAAVLVKSRTSNQKLLETIQALTQQNRPTLVK